MRAKENIRVFHSRQRSDDFIIGENEGIVLGQKTMPIEKVGVYVPGGTASYPSTVLMNILPAKIAGVSEIIMVSPPDQNGKIPDAILCAAKIAGADGVYKCGGAQAIAALAYGTQSIPKVDKIVGPGNVYVAAAKKAVFGAVDIDMIAGPSEILVLAAADANPRYIAADMLSQAEHDVLASAILICTSAELAMRVAEQIELQLSQLNREKIARKSIEDNGKIIVAKDISEAVGLVNMFAPEHLKYAWTIRFRFWERSNMQAAFSLAKMCRKRSEITMPGRTIRFPLRNGALFQPAFSLRFCKKKQFYLLYERGARFSQG
jgi:histidinol dehydrogenase